MILSWNNSRMPSQPGVVLCRSVAVNIYEAGEYLGPVTWIDMDSGIAESFVKQNGQYVLDEQGRRIIMRIDIEPGKVKMYRRMKDGADGEELTVNQIASMTLVEV